MSATSCPRLFEAEAVRDGRVVGVERASFERHAAVCASCAREVRALEAMTEALRASPEHAVDELHVRRERTRLLAAFDRSQIEPERRPRRKTWLVATGALAVLGVAVFFGWRARPTTLPAHASGVVVHADSATVWTEHTAATREEVALERGALWIHVDHAPGERRLVVVLPDGELEDTGTTFTVSADDGRTTRVAVHDGSVVLRVRGQPPVAIGAGEIWVPEAPPAASSCASAAVPSARMAPPPASAHVVAPVALVAVSDPSVDFRAAMAALDAGDDVGAAAAFAEFLVKHPGDARSEDAAYLRVIALQRAGDGARMKVAADEYLRRYPAGFRHTEVERCVGDAGK